MKMEEERLSGKFLSIYMNNTALLSLRTQSKPVTAVDAAKMYIRLKLTALGFKSL
jgi:hypothetical protein